MAYVLYSTYRIMEQIKGMKKKLNTGKYTWTDIEIHLDALQTALDGLDVLYVVESEIGTLCNKHRYSGEEQVEKKISSDGMISEWSENNLSVGKFKYTCDLFLISGRIIE